MRKLGPVKVKFEGDLTYMTKQEAQSLCVAKFQDILKFSELNSPMELMYHLAYNKFPISLFFSIILCCFGSSPGGIRMDVDK